MSSSLLISVLGPLVALVCVLATILYGLHQTRRTLRANLMTAHRLKWLDHLRADLPQLLALGERLYEETLREPNEDAITIRKELRLVSKRLIVLMGREDSLRLEFAELVRRFADIPTEPLGDELEVVAQIVFRERWNQVRTETGEPARHKTPLPRPASAAEPSDASTPDP